MSWAAIIIATCLQASSCPPGIGEERALPDPYPTPAACGEAATRFSAIYQRAGNLVPAGTVYRVECRPLPDPSLWRGLAYAAVPSAAFWAGLGYAAHLIIGGSPS
jgi:hypothetical protein